MTGFRLKKDGEMGTTPKMYKWVDGMKSTRELAEIRQLTPQNMNLLINRYGMPAAMYIKARRVAKRLPHRGLPEIPRYDPDYELKQRIKSMYQRGFTTEEIKIKERML